MFRNFKKPKDGTPNLYREESSEFRLREIEEIEAIDLKYGFQKLPLNSQKTGYLINMHSAEILDEDKRLCSAVDYYFLQANGDRFKTTLPFFPYFYVLTERNLIQEVERFLSKKYVGILYSIEVVVKEDLDLPNHLVGLKRDYIKLSFYNQTDLVKVRKEILVQVRKTSARPSAADSFYNEMLKINLHNDGGDRIDCDSDSPTHSKLNTHQQMENILDIREFDVPYHVRVSIDKRIFCGSWYRVTTGNQRDNGDGDNEYFRQAPLIEPITELVDVPEPTVLAFDIETTKMPLKFPDADTDQIMMISYMIDAQGYLITNREILSADIENFEYTPKPEFEGKFIVFNEPNESALLRKFFDHIIAVRPNIFVTYNGDFFDWPFIERRAAAHNLDMKQDIGFSANISGIYWSRSAVHMDCLCWVKRDSYLPVGSHNLKAVAKAKLRYDPVELDPEEMCPLAISDPQVLSNYSVSDAVATYYLYMQYVHPFIFALCTIIPGEPDEVLRKGSGTLCEWLLMVEAYHANIIFPNKQETILNKMTRDGHVIIQETYVGGHVEALESGIFRADIPCRFRISESTVDNLIDQIPKTLEHAITVEEGVPLENVTNLSDVTESIRKQLIALKEQPLRLERPLIYHLDVGAMYPNIILTNRLQPYASITNDAICAQCNFNKPNALCKRNMKWMMREEYMPASRNEYQRIRQQLEMEKFPYAASDNSGKPANKKDHCLRAFHELPRKDQAELEKSRLQGYCRKVYKKLKVTRMEERTTTICQKENSFYVDTVRAFRDRRYEYKTLAKQAKRSVQEALNHGNLAEIKSARNREILFDSLQLAHKCILNSFYGYVMRTGARWYSMEMAGIVCNTGAAIITEARKIIEQIGRPLELDTDGIWCVLPASFPENFEISTNLERKKSIIISYANAVLNSMVKERFTNNQYHRLVHVGVDGTGIDYVISSENSIFFEVDGPYKAMVLPASKEEGKKLKKRYAVFNFDGSIAELKGFEIKRRGELQLIKNFQSSIFESFLKGDSLESCYSAVAQVADYWLDILYSHGKNMPDSELFDLISENRSMSKKLEEYGQQKSTSISTAKRLAEFLGDEMVKDAGLACKYVIARKPENAPVTERAIPLAIFQAKAAVQKYHLRKWLKDSSIDDIDIRDILDWNYYIERLGGAIQKIITIPAAMQGVSNPVPRVQHPNWLYKKIRDKTDTFKQRKITDIFSTKNSQDKDITDIEDLNKGHQTQSFTVPNRTVVSVSTVTTNRKRNKHHDQNDQFTDDDLNKSWIEVLGNPPRIDDQKSDENYLKWLKFHKKKWLFQLLQKHKLDNIGNMNKRKKLSLVSTSTVQTSSSKGSDLGSFLQKAKRSLFTMPWQLIQILPFGTTTATDEFTIWALIATSGRDTLIGTEQHELHSIKLVVPRQYYANLKTPKAVDEAPVFRKCNRILPRSKQCYHLYHYIIPEQLYRNDNEQLLISESDANVEGVYETKTSLLFRALLSLGCICKVSLSPVPYSFNSKRGGFTLNELERVPLIKDQHYLGGRDVIKRIFFYHHRHLTKQQHMFGLFLTPLKKCLIVVVDTGRVNLMPSMNSLYNRERAAKLAQIQSDISKSCVPPEGIQFEIKMESDLGQGFKLINKALKLYKEEKKGPTLVILQSMFNDATLRTSISTLNEFPFTRIHIKDNDNLYNVLEWQKIGSYRMLRHYLNSEETLDYMIQQCRYLQIPLGNYPDDPALFGCDLFYARHLINANHVLWCSPSDAPDLGGSEENDTRLLTDYYCEKSSEVINKPGWYSSVCIEFDINCLAIATLLQSHHVTDIKGETSNDISNFSSQGSSFIDDIFSSSGGASNSTIPIYDDSSRCMEAFRLLRHMATSWIRDVSLNKNQFADYQLIHLYRWLRSSKALLYEPALLRILQMLMKKLFLQFVAEFKRLGCIVIYANYNKILICLKKYKSEDALASAEFIINSIRNKELFHSIDISYSKCYDHLVWLDSANYSGIQSNEDVIDNLETGENNRKGNSEIRESSNSNDDNNDDDNDEVDIKMDINWHLAERLPIEANCRENFKVIITSYITAIYMKLKEKQQSSLMQPLILSQSVSMGLTNHDDILDYAKELINGEISQSLFKMTEMIQTNSKQPKGRSNSSGGDDVILKNPALEFVKSVCRILNLDPSIESEVDRLRANLLCLIGIGEFSHDATWNDNNDKIETYVVPQIICQRCNHCRDIDLNRDQFRNHDYNAWYCPLCKAIYDNVEIENFLLGVVSKKFLAYNLQDLRCSKCFEVKMENFLEHCKCASEYKCLITSAQDFLSLLKTFSKLSKKFAMPALRETVEQLLKLV